jgi:hypothetical protein
MMIELTIAAIIGLAFRGVVVLWAIRRDSVLVVPRKFKESEERKVYYICAVLGAAVEEPLFRWWLVLVPMPWLILAVGVSTFIWVFMHEDGWLTNLVFGAIIAIITIYFGIWAGLVTHLVYNLAGAAIVFQRFGGVQVSRARNH